MVVYKNGSYAINRAYLDANFTGNADYVVPDGTDLAEKIISLYPNFDFVFDDDGGIADVVETEAVTAETLPEPPSNAELAAAIAELAGVICGG